MHPQHIPSQCKGTYCLHMIQHNLQCFRGLNLKGQLSLLLSAQVTAASTTALALFSLQTFVLDRL